VARPPLVLNDQLRQKVDEDIGVHFHLGGSLKEMLGKFCLDDCHVQDRGFGVMTDLELDLARGTLGPLLVELDAIGSSSEVEGGLGSQLVLPGESGCGGSWKEIRSKVIRGVPIPRLKRLSGDGYGSGGSVGRLGGGRGGFLEVRIILRFQSL